MKNTPHVTHIHGFVCFFLLLDLDLDLDLILVKFHLGNRVALASLQ